MLTQVRSALRGAVAWFVIVLLILAFALWGVPELQNFSGNAIVKVGSQSYSPQYVQNEFNRAVQIQAAESGGNFTREDAIASGLPNQIVSTLATTAAIDLFAEELRLAMPRALIRDYLNESENFQNPATGEFDRATLQSVLQRFNISVEEFENRIADELQRQQLVESLALGAPAPQPFAKYMLMRETERRAISYLIVTEEMAGKAAEPTPDDLQTYYDANAATFTAPEYRSFDLLVLTTDDFREGIEISEEEIRRLYDVNRERLYEKPERRTLYQLTFDTEAEAQSALANLRQGGSFEALALDKGRTLESVTFADARKSEILDPGVADAAFAEDIGEGDVVGPVEGVFGWTISQVAGITPPELTTYEEARPELLDQYLAQDTRRALLNAIDEVEEARDTGASLADAAASAGFEVASVGPVDRFSFAPGGAIVPNIPGEALNEAFLLEEGQQSAAINMEDGEGYLFVSVDTVEPPALKPFADVRDEAERKWRQEERVRRIADTVEGVSEMIANGETLADAAAQFDRAPTTLVIDRNLRNEAISPELSEKIFAAAPGDVVSADASLGEAQIVAVIDQTALSPFPASPDQESFFGQFLGYQLDQELIEAFLADVRDNYDIKINQAQVDALFSAEQ
ncbi:MAG: peptidyl-prolyl cis-trans isomerase [Pseudomonadota bacterium]